MNKAYRFSNLQSGEEVTVSARSVDDACHFYNNWRFHNPHVERVYSETLHIMSDRQLRQEPQLMQAIQSCSIGIACWLGHEQGWTIMPVGEELVGLTSPPKPKAQCYQFLKCEKLGDVYIIAKDMDNAMDIMGNYAFDTLGFPIAFEDFEHVSAWQFSGEMLQLRKDIFDGKCGVGLQDDDGTWKVFEVD